MKAKTEANAAGGYDPVHFSTLAAVEDKLFWFRARNQVISALAAQAVRSLEPGYRILEVGCGDGNVLRFLERACPAGAVVGMDLYGEGLRYAKGRTSCHLVQGDLTRSPFGKKFHVIGIFDVLEHIPDDRRILHDLWQLLEDGGTLLLTVPANPNLWSYFDEAAGHCRRYRLDELRAKLIDTGYRIDYLTYYMASIEPLVWLYRKARPGAANGASKELVEREVRVVPVLNGALAFLLSCEARWVAARKHFPRGTSLLAVARKPGNA